MTKLPGIPVSILVPAMLGVYALAFLAGGIYYLEQRVARIQDQFPRRGLLARLTGYAALGIGILMSLSVGGYFLNRGPDFRIGALVAAGSGVGFWIARMHADLTPVSRIRDGLLAFVCAMLTVLTGWWIAMI